jgi:hypothetical protein
MSLVTEVGGKASSDSWGKNGKRKELPFEKEKKSSLKRKSTSYCC